MRGRRSISLGMSAFDHTASQLLAICDREGAAGHRVHCRLCSLWKGYAADAEQHVRSLHPLGRSVEDSGFAVMTGRRVFRRLIGRHGPRATGRGPACDNGSGSRPERTLVQHRVVATAERSAVISADRSRRGGPRQLARRTYRPPFSTTHREPARGGRLVATIIRYGPVKTEGNFSQRGTVVWRPNS
jgi:hypothetical protein